MGFWDFLKRTIPIGRHTLSGLNDTENNSLITDQMLNNLALAEAIYSNSPPWLNEVNPPMLGAGIGAVVAAEIARLTTIESKISADNNSNIDDIIQKYIVPNLRDEMEKGWALGGLIFKPDCSNAILEIDSSNNIVNIVGNLKVSFWYPSQFLIDRRDNAGTILGVRFFQTIVNDNKFYTLVEEQTLDEKTSTLSITNKAYETTVMPTKYKWDNLGVKTIPLNTIDRWRDRLPLITIQRVSGCLVGFFRPAVANNSNVNSPYGLSPLVRAANAIRRADRVYNNLDWELDASLARIYVDQSVLDGSIYELPKNVTKTFVRLSGSPDKLLFEKYSPEIREESYLRIYNSYLRQIEDIVGLAHGTISEVETVARTATEIAAMRQRTYATISDNQRNLEAAIRQLAYALQIYMNPTKIEPLSNITFSWDDSIVSNPAEQLNLYMLLQNAGNIPSYETNMMYFNCSEQKAKKLVAEAAKENFKEMNDNYEGEFE